MSRESRTHVELPDAVGGQPSGSGGGGGTSVGGSRCNGCTFFSVSVCP